MPVPVPVYTKQPAHPVIKINHPSQPDSKSSVFQQHLTHSLPLPPQGPPPSFATREEWISSLPSWRRNKQRRIWEDESAHSNGWDQQGFAQGLTAAENALVIKGELAQACIPPVGGNKLDTRSYVDMYPPPEDSDEEMSAYPAAMQDWRSEDDSFPEFSPADNKYYDHMASDSPSDVVMDYAAPTRAITRSYSAPVSGEAYARFERGAFSPVLEDLSPEVPENFSPELHNGGEPSSSPIGPATPFADYVDSAFAEAHARRAVHRNHDVDVAAHYQASDGYHASCYQCQTYQPEQSVQQVPVVESVVAPVATTAYKKLAAPLSEWLVSFVWRACTTGMRLPQEYAQPFAFAKEYPTAPPSHLAAATHSMLLSTLLQPSAVFLALWYIVRLPVFFGPVGLTAEHGKEMRFRAELLGEAHLGTDRDIIEAYAPFRLILLGCMLANKWLDDHTFSNKTWHTISNVPIRSLNHLESLALEIFQYDLSITPEQWADWLGDLMGYHQTLSSPMFPQPISRPSSSPHVIVRQAIETLVNAGPVGCRCVCVSQDAQTCGPPQPVFVGLEDGKKDKMEYDEMDDVLEIDLDEDGPLREEYMPRRRFSSRSRNFNAESHAKVPERTLPPPAKWSPAADEPIIRGREHRAHGQYVAPQPLSHISMGPPPFQPPVEVHRTSWPMSSYMVRHEPIHRPTVFAPPPVFQAPAPGFEYGYGMPLAHHSHVRSHSLTYNQAVAEQAPARTRSYSQSQYDHSYSDSADAHYAPPPMASHWAGYDRMGFPTSYDRPLGLHHRPSLKA